MNNKIMKLIIYLNFIFRTFMIVAPRRVRPDQTVQVFVSIFRHKYIYVTVTAYISKEGRQLTSTSGRFHPGSSRLIQMKVSKIFNIVSRSFHILLGTVVID